MALPVIRPQRRIRPANLPARKTARHPCPRPHRADGLHSTSRTAMTKVTMTDRMHRIVANSTSAMDNHMDPKASPLASNSNVNLGNPEDAAFLHTSYRLPSRESHLSNSTIAAITNGEYVDLASLLPFSTLLPNHVASNLRLQLGNEGLTIPLLSPAECPKITGIN